MRRETAVFVWRCKQGSNIYAGKRLLPTSAQPRLYWQIWLRCMRCITARQGLTETAKRISFLAQTLAGELQENGFVLQNKNYFDTVTIRINDIKKMKEVSENHQMNFYYPSENLVTISLDETTTKHDVLDIISVFNTLLDVDTSSVTFDNDAFPDNIPVPLTRTSQFLTHPVFNSYPQRNGNHAVHEIS